MILGAGSWGCFLLWKWREEWLSIQKKLPVLHSRACMMIVFTWDNTCWNDTETDSASIFSSVCVFACSRYMGLKLFKQHANCSVILQWSWAPLRAHLGKFGSMSLPWRAGHLSSYNRQQEEKKKNAKLKQLSWFWAWFGTVTHLPWTDV